MKINEKSIRSEDGDSYVLFQWGSERLVMSPSTSALTFTAHGIDKLIAVLVRARSQMRKPKRANLFVRMPAEAKQALQRLANKKGMSLNALAIQAIGMYLLDDVET